MAFRYLTAGESHGKGLVGILEGLPSGLELTAEDLHFHLKRRKLGYGRGFRQKIEDDRVEILSGVRHGKTMGSPISLLIWNKDWKSWTSIMQVEPFRGKVKRQVDVPRPGHADLVGGIKYAHSDMRNVLERSSARETTMRVALGTVARSFLEKLGIDIASRVTSIGSIEDRSPLKLDIKKLNAKTDTQALRCSNAKIDQEMISEVDRAQKRGDTLGGCFEVYASGVSIGLGSYSQWDRRLEGSIGQTFLSLNAIKGVEMGMGFETARVPGSKAHDEILLKRGRLSYRSNRAGGVTGGMTTGQNIVVRAAMKPISTLMKPLASVNMKSRKATKAHVERSDVCAVPSAAVIGESLLALVLAEAILEKFGGDSMKELIPRVKAWNKATA